MSAAHRRTAGLALFCLLAVPAARAGEVVCFAPGEGKTCSQSVLGHVEFKAVVTEFIDPGETGIGHSISRLLWREVLESISDVKGAGVILAYDARDQLKTLLEGRDYRAFLQSDYHGAAVRIAGELGTQLALWGAVLEHEGAVHVEPFLTLLPRPDEQWNTVNLRIERGGLPPLSAQIARRRLNFAPLRTGRAELFHREWLTRCSLSAGCPRGIEVREGPGNSFAVVDHVPAGTMVKGRDMREQWVAIERAGGVSYVNIYHLEVVAPAVHVPGKSVRLRAAPASQAALLSVSAAAGSTHTTREARRVGGRLWYQVEIGGVAGWLPPETVQRDYRFPVVHFVAGLYRYARRDYARAAGEFTRFIERGAEREDNATLATAYQYLAASKLALAGMNGVMGAREAVGDIEKAVQQTPFDPDVYALSSVVRFGSFADPEAALLDLSRSLDLDADNPAARKLLGQLTAIAQMKRTQSLTPGADPQRMEAEISKLGEAVRR